jgi:hypothetical protein
MFLSNTGHEKSRMNLGRPLSKAKYELVTDSEPVPWGKGEKNPDKGSETESETACLQAARGRWWDYGPIMPDCVPFA